MVKVATRPAVNPVCALFYCTVDLTLVISWLFRLAAGVASFIMCVYIKTPPSVL